MIATGRFAVGAISLLSAYASSAFMLRGFARRAYRTIYRGGTPLAGQVHHLDPAGLTCLAGLFEPRSPATT